VFDVTLRETLNDLVALKELYLSFQDKNSEDPSFILVGNKCDKVQDRVIDVVMAREWASAHGCVDYFETCAVASSPKGLPAAELEKRFLGVYKVFVCAGQQSKARAQFDSENTVVGLGQLRRRKAGDDSDSDSECIIQ